MEDFNSKYSGEQVEELLDMVANGEAGGGGGGIAVETDPVFSASPAASITEEKKAEWDNKVDKVSGKQLSTEDFTTILKTKLEGLSNYDDTELSEALSTLRGDFDKLVSGDTTTAIKTFNEVIAFLDGIQDSQDLSSIIASIEQQIAGKMDNVTLAKVATSGNYNDLSDKPTIPSAVNESTVSGWGFTKNEGTITEVKMNGASKGTSGVVDLGDVPSKATVDDLVDVVNGINDDVADLIKNKENTIADLGAIRDGAAKGATALQEHQTLKTINGESIVGEGDIKISGADGDDGATFTPSVDSSGNLSWTNNKGLTNPPTVNIKGPKGDKGDSGSGGGGSSSGSGKEYIVVEPDLSIAGSEAYIADIVPNTTYIVSEPVSLLSINEFSVSDALSDEYNVIFKADYGGTTLTINSDNSIYWANGVIPTIETAAVYELSIQRVTLGGGNFFNAVLTYFKIIE